MALKVNGETIPESAIEFELARLVKFFSQHMAREEIEKQMPVLRTKARDQAVGAKLLIAEARRLDLLVPQDEVERRLQRLIDDAGGPELFEKRMSHQSLTWDMVRESLDMGARVDALIAQVTAGVPDPTEAELEEHFRQHAGEYVKADRAQAQHILVTFSAGDAAERAVATSKIVEIRRRLGEGADFSDEAAAHSDCPSGRKAAGSLGWFSRGMMLPDIEQAVFAMNVGDVSGVIESPLGLHLVKKTGEEAGGAVEFGEVKEKIREFLRHARRGEAVAAYVRDLRARARVEVE